MSCLQESSSLVLLTSAAAVCDKPRAAMPLSAADTLPYDAYGETPTEKLMPAPAPVEPAAKPAPLVAASAGEVDTPSLADLQRLLAETQAAVARAERAEAAAAQAAAEAAALRAENEALHMDATAGGLVELMGDDAPGQAPGSAGHPEGTRGPPGTRRRRTKGPGSGHPLTRGAVPADRLTARVRWTEEEEAELLRLLGAYRSGTRPNWTKVMSVTGGVLLPGSPGRTLDSFKKYASKFFVNLGASHAKKPAGSEALASAAPESGAPESDDE